ncbi:MAG: hypothetical protein BMS9Abin07_0431 [Acidimicrobiia bacterium]|nr:MAG: hypothetical protein BMS9Abin07_0431 [Acidimicrobiia bacterium]
MLTKIRSLQFDRAISMSLGLAVLWVVLPFLRSETTFHLAPVLVAAALPVGAAYSTPERISTRHLVLATVGGLAIALAATLILTVAGKLTELSLLPFGGAVTEAVLFSIVGAMGGFVIALLRRNS